MDFQAFVERFHDDQSTSHNRGFYTEPETRCLWAVLTSHHPINCTLIIYHWHNRSVTCIWLLSILYDLSFVCVFNGLKHNSYSEGVYQKESTEIIDIIYIFWEVTSGKVKHQCFLVTLAIEINRRAIPIPI